MKVKKVIQHYKFVIKSPLVVPRLIQGIVLTKLGKTRLRSIELGATEACQCKCPFCYAKDVSTTGGKRLTLEEIKSVWKQCRDLGVIHANLTGGDPLLRPDICEVIKALNPKSTIVSLVTNGVALNREMIYNLKKAGLNTIQISLDSMDKETHDAGRGVKGCWDKIMEGAAIAKEAGLVVCISSILSHEKKSFNEFNRIFDFCKEKGYFLLINRFGNVGGSKDSADELLTKNEFEQIKAYLNYPFVRQDNMLNYSLKMECPAGREKIYITFDGEVMPCCMIQKSYGNVRQHSIKELLNNMRKDYNESVDCYRYKDSKN